MAAPRAERPEPVPAEAGPASVPAARAAAPVTNGTAPYRIHAGDTLHLQVAGEADLTGDFKAASDGTIVLPLLGRTPVEGRTVAELERGLTAALAKDFLVDPKVYVQVRSSVMRRVILFGEVKSPGVYELPVGDRFTLLQLIAKAGGFTDVAAPDRVRIVRREGGERTFKVNVTDLLLGRGQEADIELLPNDVITVPQTVF